MAPSPPGKSSHRTQGKDSPAPSPGASGSGKQRQRPAAAAPASSSRKKQRLPATDAAPTASQREESKRLFLAEVDAGMADPTKVYKLFSAEQHASVMTLLDGLEELDKDAHKDRIKECRAANSWDASKVHRLVKKFMVQRSKSPTDGKTYADLVHIKGKTLVPHRGSIYEAIEREHLAHGHAKSKGLFHAVNMRYGGDVPRWVCELFGKYCPLCTIKMPVKPKVCVVCTCIHALLRLLDLRSIACLHACSGGRAHTHHLGRLGCPRPV